MSASLLATADEIVQWQYYYVARVCIDMRLLPLKVDDNNNIKYTHTDICVCRIVHVYFRLLHIDVAGSVARVMESPAFLVTCV
jgi:hypothetical protein